MHLAYTILPYSISSTASSVVIGLGHWYITPVSTLVKYFPNRPGFATGLAIMGFGFASLIAGPLMQFLVAQFGLVNNFINSSV